MKTLITFLILILISNQNFFSQDKKRELRGAWVATVANIDWPTRNATSGQQIAELVSLFDKLKSAGINVIYFQIRTECDALYNSAFEPWSYWLTGEQGVAPEPYFDPLAFAIEEAHARGMELHAWLNPYRAIKTTGDYTPAENHVSQVNPDWMLNFGSYQMIDPGLPEVRDYIANVISDVIKNYDVDGIHFDDYFYPYTPKISNEDNLTFVKHNNGQTDIDQWRRDNINKMVSQVYDTINAIKPYISYGISPFGIVENHYAGTNGMNSYSVIYCDPLTWLRDKTVDYVIPQIYWHIGFDIADYSKLLPWWASVSYERHLYVGLYSSRFLGNRHNGSPTELGDQMRLNRVTENVQGEVFFSAKSIANNIKNFADTLRNDFYSTHAFPPKMEWKDNFPPNSPNEIKLRADSNGVTIWWDIPVAAEDGDVPFYYAVYRFNKGEVKDYNNQSKIVHLTPFNGNRRFRDNIKLSSGDSFYYAITSFDRRHNESSPIEIEFVYE